MNRVFLGCLVCFLVALALEITAWVKVSRCAKSSTTSACLKQGWGKAAVPMFVVSLLFLMALPYMV